MQAIGFVGIGKIGLPICANLIKSGYSVVGYRRHALTEFEKLGGVPARSAEDVGRLADIVFTCLPSDDALEDVVRGPNGLLNAARPGQIVVELGSHPVSVKERYVTPLADKGATFIDGEVSGTPGMVAERKGAIYLGGPNDSIEVLKPVIAGFADVCLHLGAFGTATQVKLVNNLLVALHIAGTAEAMAMGLKAGIDKDLLIKAVTSGSGASTQFAIRAPWMAARRFTPQQGSAAGLAHYLDGAKDMAGGLNVATPLLDTLIEIFAQAVPAIGDRDVAAILEFFERPNQATPKGANDKERTS